MFRPAILLLCLLLVYPFASPGRAQPAEASPPAATGRVLTEEGTPADQVTVYLEITDMRIRRPIDRLETRTDLTGRFSFDLSDHRAVPRLGLEFSTSSPRFQDHYRIVQVDQEELPLEVELTLRLGTVVRGRIIDGKGDPLEGVEVSARGARPVYTEADGAFELVGLAAPTRNEVVAFLEGYSTGVLPIRSDEPAILDDLTITLLSSANLSGRVFSPRGTPVGAGVATLKFAGLFRQTPVRNDGTFLFEDVPLSLENPVLLLSAEGYREVERPLTSDELATMEVEIHLDWPLALAGNVSTPEGTPAVGATVLLLEAERDRVQERLAVDTEGRWKSRPVAIGETVRLLVMPGGAQARSGAGELQISRGDAADSWTGTVDPWPDGFRSSFTISARGDEFRMERRDEGPGGLPGTILYEGTLADDRGEASGTITASATGATGEFRLRKYTRNGQLEGQWDLRERLDAGTPPHSPAISTIPLAPFPGTQHVDLALGRARVLAGMVLNEEGRPLPAGTVRVIRWADTQLFQTSAPVEAGGGFRLEGLPEGVFQLAVYDERGTPLSAALFMRGGLEDVVISLEDTTRDPLDSLASIRKPGPSAPGN